MERLLRDAEKMAGYIEGSLDIESFADVAEAIHIVQEEMGITGTTAKEAGRTISGSIGAMKSAWQNLITGLADGNADIGQLVDNLVTTIVGDGTESNLGVLGNVMPAVKTALNGASELVSELLPAIVQEIPEIINDNLPILTKAAISIIQSLVDGISKNHGMLIETALDTIVFLANSFISMLPEIAKVGGWIIEDIIEGITDAIPDLLNNTSALIEQLVGIFSDIFPEITILAAVLIETLAAGLGDNVGTIINAIFDVMNTFVLTICDPWVLEKLLDAALVLIVQLVKGLVSAVPNLIDAALQLVMNLIDFILNEENLNAIINAALEIILVVSEGLVKAIPQLVDAAIQIIEKLVDFFLDPGNIAMLLDMAFQLVVAIVEGLGKAAVELVKGATNLVKKLVEVFKETDWKTLGKNVVDGIWNGLKSTWASLKKWFTDAWDSLVAGVKDLLGIHSPSRVFAGIGKNMALGVGEGWENKFKAIKKNIDKSLHFDDASIAIDASVKRTGGVFGNGSAGVSVVQNIYSQAKTAADLMQEALYQQKRAVILGV